MAKNHRILNAKNKKNNNNNNNNNKNNNNKNTDETLQEQKDIPIHGDVLTRQPDTRVSDKDIPYNRTKLSATSKYSCLILKIKKVGQYVKLSKFL